MTGTNSTSDGDTQLPCPSCGTECLDEPEVRVEVEWDFEFGGETATRELPGRECPNCGWRFAL